MDSKIEQFTQAIEKYLKYPRYQRIETWVSFFVVTLQAMTLLSWFGSAQTISCVSLVVTLLLAYVVTDFINGLVHLFMDNNTHYVSIFGPYVAAFHLHHAKYFYRIRPLLKVYFDESGTKFWLLAYLICLFVIQFDMKLNVYLNLGLVAFGIFSSVAELSHYWCHQATEENRMILWLQNHHILLSKEKHKAHHASDNIQYAFLNGVTDPLINLIARRCYQGYKNHADKHTKMYMERQKRAIFSWGVTDEKSR